MEMADSLTTWQNTCRWRKWCPEVDTSTASEKVSDSPIWVTRKGKLLCFCFLRMQANTWSNLGWWFLMKQCGLLLTLNSESKWGRNYLDTRAGQTGASVPQWLYLKFKQNPFNLMLFLQQVYLSRKKGCAYTSAHSWNCCCLHLFKNYYLQKMIIL